jgi:5'-deoxynucleotidase YfbR-like HD superfamily hydrolase
VLARKEGVKNEEKVLKMALVHDISETRTSDHSYVQKVYVQENESGAARDMFSSTSLSDFESEILEEFVKRKSPEAHVVKDADNLDIDLELKELEAIGSQVVPKWRAFRRKVRDEKLYTKSARELWDLIQDADPDRWHLEINKWVRHPNAGK